MKFYQTILFDLDGTLIDSSAGLAAALKYALNHFNIECSPDSVREMVGPPLMEGIPKVIPELRGNEELLTQIIKVFREHYARESMYQCTLYPGIPELLLKLKNNQKKLAIATYKPTVFSKQIMEHLQLDHLFDVIMGSELNKKQPPEKDSIVTAAMNAFSDLNKEKTVMIGDRHHDIHAAKNNQIDSIAVTYGFGLLEELQQAQPTQIAHDIAYLEAILLPH